MQTYSDIYKTIYIDYTIHWNELSLRTSSLFMVIKMFNILENILLGTDSADICFIKADFIHWQKVHLLH